MIAANSNSNIFKLTQVIKKISKGASIGAPLVICCVLNILGKFHRRGIGHSCNGGRQCH